MTVLSISALTKRFGNKEVLRDLDLELTPGQVTVLLGPNGAGKSTLMRLALGLLRPDSGSISVHGHDPLAKSALVRRQTGFVPDTPDVYPWMTAKDLCRFLRPQYPGWDQHHADELLELLRVPLTTPFKSMSRGEGMKTMLVAALAPRPPLLLLDEPFAGLDPLVRDEVLQGIISALREGERTVLCSTHDLEIAARIADRVAVLAHGQIARHGTVEEVLQSGEPSRVPEQMHKVLAEAVTEHGDR